ncbi:hypothetical protein T09_684 [Trichinella sp. T9]|nr:hypothetical protein T09_684 [Trichinella sp. T9]
MEEIQQITDIIKSYPNAASGFTLLLKIFSGKKNSNYIKLTAMHFLFTSNRRSIHFLTSMTNNSEFALLRASQLIATKNG